MGDDFRFGGGASGTNIHPVVLAATLLVAAMVLFSPRKYLFAPIAFIVFLTPFGEELNAAGFHFYMVRIIIFAGVLRMCAKPLPAGNFVPLERTFFLWVFLRGVAFILLFREGGAVVNQIAFWLDAYGAYLLFRYLIRNEEDVFSAIKSLTLVAAILAVCMSCEYLSRNNPFNFIRVIGITPLIRNGRVRAQGTFANAITAGTVGATLMPLFFWLWKSGKARLSGAVGLTSSTVIVITSASSTPLTSFLGGVLALCLWPIRKQMRSVRWGIVFTVIGLALVMKAPVWYLLARVDFVGGHGWDRAYLVEQCVRHISDWWLVGTKDNASWGSETWDQCNQFVAEAESGGLITLVLFIIILSRGFSMIGRARKRVEGAVREEWLFWCLGAALFCHVVTFLGIDYFDQTRVWWFAFLAMIPAATALRAERVALPTEEPQLEFGAMQRDSTVAVLSEREMWFREEQL